MSFPCVHCYEGVEALTETGFAEHYRMQHRNFKSECKTCHNKFRDKKALELHLETKHEQKAVEVSISCVHCNNRKFLYERGISQHYAHLHPKFLVKCGFCKNCFLDIVDKNDHVRRAHGAKGSD